VAECGVFTGVYFRTVGPYATETL